MSICTFPVKERNSSSQMVNGFWKRFFNATVYVKFRVCLKYENDMMSLCETTNVFIDAFCYPKIHLHLLGPFKLIKTMLKFSHVS